MLTRDWRSSGWRTVSSSEKWGESKNISRSTKLITATPNHLLRSYEVKWSVCARHWTLFTTLFTIINIILNPEPSFFLWTGSFEQFVSLNWFNSLVWLRNHAIASRIRNYIIKAQLESEWLWGVWKWVLMGVTVLLEPWTVLDASVRFSELVQLFHQNNRFKRTIHSLRTSLRTVCLRLWITGNNVVNNVQFLSQTNNTDCLAAAVMQRLRQLVIGSFI